MLFPKLILVRSLLRLYSDATIAKVSENTGHFQPNIPLVTVGDSETSYRSQKSISYSYTGYPVTADEIDELCLLSSSSASNRLFGYLQFRRTATVKCLEMDTQMNKSRQRDMYKYTVSLRMPVWLINRIWEIQGMRARKGWTFTISSYNIVPSDSLVLQHARLGNLQGLQDLFSKNLASPFDRNEYGLTVLHVSIHAAQNLSKTAHES